MQQSGQYRIGAPREAVWRALNDPDVLARCIEGCESMTKIGDDAFNAAVRARIGPLSALFNAEVRLTDLDPPNSYTLQGNVKGGAAGFGKGSAQVALSDADGATLLKYDVEGNVGGKLAQVGQRLIDGAARKMADDFFAKFAAEVAPGDSARTDTPAAASALPMRTILIWAAAAAAIAIAIVLIGQL